MVCRTCSRLSGSSGTAVSCAQQQNILHTKFLRTDSECIPETLSWFEPELRTLHQSPNVNLRLHCTGHIPDADQMSLPSSFADKGIEKKPSSSISYAAPPTEKDVEKPSVPPHQQARPVQLAHRSSLPPLCPGRPDIPLILADAVRGMGRYERICVGACGPRSMLDMTRNAVAAANASAGPVVDLHVETYGW